MTLVTGLVCVLASIRMVSSKEGEKAHAPEERSFIGFDRSCSDFYGYVGCNEDQADLIPNLSCIRDNVCQIMSLLIRT